MERGLLAPVQHRPLAKIGHEHEHVRTGGSSKCFQSDGPHAERSHLFHAVHDPNETVDL